jgi:hypothetical protein
MRRWAEETKKRPRNEKATRAAKKRKETAVNGSMKSRAILEKQQGRELTKRS